MELASVILMILIFILLFGFCIFVPAAINKLIGLQLFLLALMLILFGFLLVPLTLGISMIAIGIFLILCGLLLLRRKVLDSSNVTGTILIAVSILSLAITAIFYLENQTFIALGGNGYPLKPLIIVVIIAISLFLVGVILLKNQ